MAIERVLAIGGYGLAGTRIARLLLAKSSVSLLIGGPNLDKAEELARRCNKEYPGSRARGVQMDVLDRSSIDRALVACDLVIDCVPIGLCANARIAQAAHDAGIEYINLNMTKEEVGKLTAIQGSNSHTDLHTLAHCGVFPGLPSVLVRLAARSFDRLDRATVAMIGSATGAEASTSSLKEMLSADIKTPSVYRNNAWVKASISASRKIDFGPPFGHRKCYLCNLEEMEDLPASLGIGECELYAAETNTFTMIVLLLWNVLRLNRLRKGIELGARLLRWGVRKFAKQPFGITLKIEARGVAHMEKRTLGVYAHCSDVYESTAICAVACVLQLINAKIEAPGAAYMGHVVDIDRYMEDAQTFGMTVRTVWA